MYLKLSEQNYFDKTFSTFFLSIILEKVQNRRERLKYFQNHTLVDDIVEKNL